MCIKAARPIARNDRLSCIQLMFTQHVLYRGSLSFLDERYRKLGVGKKLEFFCKRKLVLLSKIYKIESLVTYQLASASKKTSTIIMY